jgi:hypothetical protein
MLQPSLADYFIEFATMISAAAFSSLQELFSARLDISRKEAMVADSIHPRRLC